MNKQPGVLLDLDGTLIDTAPDLAGAANALRDERGMPPLPFEELRNQCSFGARGMLRAALGLEAGHGDYDSARQQFLERYRARLTAESRPFAGMRKALSTLADHGVVWGVVTNKVEAYALPLMDALAFEPRPACVIGGDSAGAPKPDPAPLFLGCKHAGLTPQNTVYVGDSDRDITAGHAAGMRTIGVRYGYFEPDEPLESWGADCWIAHPDELAATVLRLLAQPKTGATVA